MSQKDNMSSHYQQLRANGMNHSRAFASTGKHFTSMAEKNNYKQPMTKNNGDFMIRTKSIQEKSEPSDGCRISVMRYPKGEYDEDCREVAPSSSLLLDYKKGRTTWPEYEKRYNHEMKQKTPIIKKLAERAKKETITLLCFERTDEKCHRRLLKNIIEKIGNCMG